MTEIQQKPAICGFVGTVALWILIFLFFYFSSLLFAPKQFKTIKIRLDAPTKNEQVTRNTEKATSDKASVQESSLQNNVISTETSGASEMEKSIPQKGEVSPSLQPASQSSATPSAGDTPATPPQAPSLPTRNAPSEPKKSEVKPKSEPQKSAAKTTPAATKKAETKTVEQPKPQATPATQQVQKSMDELIAEQQAKRPAPKKEFDWSQFDAMEGNSSSSSSSSQIAKAPPTPANTNAFSGSAASSSNSASTATSSKSTSARTSGNQTASSATLAALSGAASSSKYAGSVKSSGENSASSDSSDGNLKTSDGRALIKPNPPTLTITSEAENIAGTYTIKFTVTPDGHVDLKSIQITPNILPTIIQNELKTQLTQNWLFSSSDTFGTAQFAYTIQKK